MAFSTYDPYRQLAALSREMQRLAVASPVRAEEAGGVHASDWAPTVDIKEGDDHFSIYADVPGVDSKDIDVSMHNGVLTIKGERRAETKEESNRFSRVERARGTFLRRFTLPDTADDDNISATTKDGVLVVRIPKRASVQPKKISVQG
ncbi:MAG: HSP20 family protein [Gammaproteobacteria bacterium]|jgi:HSP20 family protein